MISNACKFVAAYLFIALLFVGGCVSPTPPPAPPGGNAQSDAALLKKMATTPRKAEAEAWLRTKDGKIRNIGDSSENLTAADSLRLVQSLQDAGAIRVVAVDIETDTHLETTSTLIVELPTAPDKRKRVFAVEARNVKTTAFDPTPDTGQKYLLLHW